MKRPTRIWPETTLDRVAECVMGQAPPSSQCNFDEDGTPFVKAGEFGEERPILREWTTRPLKLAKKTDVLICVVGATSGKLNLGADCAIGRSVAAIRPKSDTFAEFLYYQLLPKVQALRAASTGSAQGVISKDMLASIKITLPTLDQQRRIVAKLDSLFARSKSARGELGHIPKLVERYKQAILETALRGDLTAEWRNSTSRRLEDWHPSCIGDIADVGTGATPKRGTLRFYHKGTIPWVTSGAVNEETVDHAEEMITKAALKETNCKLFPPGTLLVAMYGEGQTRGKVSVLKIHAATNQALAAINIREPERVCSKFVFWFLRANYLELRRRAAGGVQPNLNLGMIKATALNLPSVEEQLEVVRRIEELLQRVDSLTREASVPLKLLDRLEQATLVKAFHGELA